MNCLYITLFFNIVAGIVQTFIKSWKQLLCPRVIEVCRQHFEPRHDFFLHPIIVVTVQGLLLGFRSVVKEQRFISSHNGVQKLISFLSVAREKHQRGTWLWAGFWIVAAITNTSHFFLMHTYFIL